jgi:hypothetical protein
MSPFRHEGMTPSLLRAARFRGLFRGPFPHQEGRERKRPKPIQAGATTIAASAPPPNMPRNQL